MQTTKRGVPGSVLKWVAILTMFVDHAAASLVYGLAKYSHAWGTGLLSKGGYWFLRGVGRLGFPLFCFLLVEGFFHTHDRKKYGACSSSRCCRSCPSTSACTTPGRSSEIPRCPSGSASACSSAGRTCFSRWPSACWR